MKFLVDPSRPIVRRLFKKIDCTEQLTRLAAAMQEIFSSDPEIREIVWTNAA